MLVNELKNSLSSIYYNSIYYLKNEVYLRLFNFDSLFDLIKLCKPGASQSKDLKTRIL